MKGSCISIAGNIASGKSEVAKMLGQKLKMQVYSASEAVRELAKSKHMTMLELNEYISSKPEYDKLIDEKTKTFVVNNKDYILDARLGFYIDKDSFKVFLSTNKKAAVERILLAGRQRGPVETYNDEKEASEAIEKRESSEHERYKRIYKVDIYDMSNYDLVIDSTKLSVDEVTKKIIEEYLKWKEKGLA